jgi:ribosomal protein S12 methylthiotransferase accessory factor YcaO
MDRDAIVAWVRAGATMLELPAATADEAAVVENLERLAAIAAALERVDIAPDVEPLTVFVR